MKLSILGKMGLAAIGFCIGYVGTVVRAETVLLEDNFNAENSGNGTTNFFDFQNWTVEDGSVDLIGNGFYDFFPGNGLYLDLDGTTANAGRLVSNNLFSFDIGDTINLSFDLHGSNGPSFNTVEVSLGNLFAETFTNNDIGRNFRNFEATLPVTNVPLIFDHAGGDYNGLFLDNVRLAVDSVNAADTGEKPPESQSVPEASAVLGLLALGTVGSLRKWKPQRTDNSSDR